MFPHLSTSFVVNIYSSSNLDDNFWRLFFVILVAWHLFTSLCCPFTSNKLVADFKIVIFSSEFLFVYWGYVTKLHLTHLEKTHKIDVYVCACYLVFWFACISFTHYQNLMMIFDYLALFWLRYIENQLALLQ